jgi:hypothetical protein
MSGEWLYREVRMSKASKYFFFDLFCALSPDSGWRARAAPSSGRETQKTFDYLGASQLEHP